MVELFVPRREPVRGNTDPQRQPSREGGQKVGAGLAARTLGDPPLAPHLLERGTTVFTLDRTSGRKRVKRRKLWF